MRVNGAADQYINLALTADIDMSIAENVAKRFANLETSQDILDQIKKLDIQIKHSTSIAARRQWIISRNNLARKYNQLTGKTPSDPPRMPTNIPPSRTPTTKIY